MVLPPGTRQLVCITGMHRSGTSLATRALQLLGLPLGDPEALLAPGPDNPAGYFENRSIQEFDDELLAHLGGSWDRPPTLSGHWSLHAGLDPFRAHAAAVLAAQFGDDEVIGFKDPRASLLLPFWRTVAPVKATVVLVRDPLEVAASLGRRNQIEPPQAALLWLRYLLAATRNDPDHLLVRHRDLFDDRGPTLARMARHLGLPAPTADVDAAVADHLDPTLSHPAPDTTTAWSSNPLVQMADRVWNRGQPDLTALSPEVTSAVTDGWLRPPADGEALDRARAEAVSFKEQLKRRNDVVRSLKAGQPPPPDQVAFPVLDPDETVADPARLSPPRPDGVDRSRP
jgi:hypothetical protein